MSGKGWRLTRRGRALLIDVPVAFVFGLILATAAYFGASGGF